MSPNAINPNTISSSTLSSPSLPALQATGLTKIYKSAGIPPVTILNAFDLTLAPGDVVALIGPSGSGKSTLLHMLGLLDQPTQGEIFIKGKNTATLSPRDCAKLRAQNIGFIYQHHHLLPEFTALENVIMPQMIAYGPYQPAFRARAESLLTRVGLHKRQNHLPSQLSGGEQQRVAIARAIANNPAIILADEPTGNLDPATAEDIWSLLSSLAAGSPDNPTRTCLLMATHNHAFSQKAHRVIQL